MSAAAANGRLALADLKRHKIGNYWLTGTVLGKGFFARVEEAVHMRLNVKVAIKIFDLKKMTDKYMLKHIRREAIILSLLSHPSIVTLYEVHETDTNYFLVEEIGEGGNLSEYVRTQKNRRVDDKRARSFCQQLTSAVAHLHQRGVIHRDLKMDNILLDKNKERIKLADFGFSNTWTPTSFLSTHCGSPEYAAPELFSHNKPYGPEIDIWSLGVVFYAMILGRLPFSVAKRAHETHDDNRARLVAELKIGFAPRHRMEMQPCNVLFKIIIPKMLVPIPNNRITIDKLLDLVLPIKPVWNEYPETSEEWKYLAIEKLSFDMNIPIGEVQTKLLLKPLSSIGGIFNIRRHTYQLRLLNLAPPTRQVNFRTIKSPPVVFATQHKISLSHENRIKPQQQRIKFPSGGSVSSSGSDVETCRRVQLLRPKTPHRPYRFTENTPERRCKTAAGNLDNNKLSKPATPRSNPTRPLTGGGIQSTAPVSNRLTRMKKTNTNRDKVAVTPLVNVRCCTAPSEGIPRAVAVMSSAKNGLAKNAEKLLNGDAKARKFSGIPTYTAARAAIRREKAESIEKDRSDRVKSLATRRASISAKVKNTFEHISRSVSKMLDPTKKRTGAAGLKRNHDINMYGGDTKAVDRHRINGKIEKISKEVNQLNIPLGKGPSKLAFWRSKPNNKA